MTNFYFFIFLLIGCLFCGEEFENSVLCLVDEKDHTYFFRGKLPQQDGKFCYEELRHQIKSYLMSYDRTVSSDFKLICVSLLNHFADKKESMIESKWFSAHPDKGWVWRYPLFGYCCSPHYVPKGLRRLFYFVDPDGVRYLVSQLKNLVDYDYGEDAVIYMHCNAGKDRTGEATACYLMQYKGYSYREAMTFNQRIARRKLRLMSINAIRWNAYYLREVCNLLNDSGAISGNETNCTSTY